MSLEYPREAGLLVRDGQPGKHGCPLVVSVHVRRLNQEPGCIVRIGTREVQRHTGEEAAVRDVTPAMHILEDVSLSHRRTDLISCLDGGDCGDRILPLDQDDI